MSSSGRNPKNVVIIGALDTKGMEFAFIKDLIEKEAPNLNNLLEPEDVNPKYLTPNNNIKNKI